MRFFTLAIRDKKINEECWGDELAVILALTFGMSKN